MEMKTYLLKHWESVIKPEHAFITCSNEETYQRAIWIFPQVWCGKVQRAIEWNSTALEFKASNEPSNIHFTNLYQKWTWNKKLIMIITLTLVIMIACFILFSTQKISKNLSNYFPNVNCEELISDLQNREDML